MTRFERYVAIGDSTTEGVDDPDAHGGYRGWANRFAEHLAAAQGSVQYANLAIRGKTSPEIRSEQLEPALALKPDITTVVAGVNDLLRPKFDADVVGAHISAMISMFRNQNTTVLTFTLPDMTRVMPAARILRGRIEALNARLRATCDRTGALLVDLAAVSLAGDPRLWSSDRLHANALGHERIAAALAHRVGLPGFDDSWSRPLPTEPPRGVKSALEAEASWIRSHLGPWLWRHARGISSGDGIVAKHPRFVTLTSTSPK